MSRTTSGTLDVGFHCAIGEPATAKQRVDMAMVSVSSVMFFFCVFASAYICALLWLDGSVIFVALRGVGGGLAVAGVSQTVLFLRHSKHGMMAGFICVCARMVGCVDANKVVAVFFVCLSRSVRLRWRGVVQQHVFVVFFGIGVTHVHMHTYISDAYFIGRICGWLAGLVVWGCEGAGEWGVVGCVGLCVGIVTCVQSAARVGVSRGRGKNICRTGGISRAR